MGSPLPGPDGSQGVTVEHPRTKRSLSLGPLLRVLAGGTIISFSAVFVKLTQVGPSTSVFYRVLFGGLALLVFAVLRRESFRASGRIWIIVLFSSFFFALDLEAWHRAILYIGPGLATILANFQVFILALAGMVLFGERLSKRFLVALPVAIAGLWLLLGVDVQDLPDKTIIGVLLGLSAALCYAAYILVLRLSRNSQGSLSPVANMAVISLGTAGFSGLFSLFHEVSFSIPTLVDGGYLLVYGIFCQGLGWLLLSKALPELPAAIAGLLLLIQPTLSFIWDIVLFQRPTGAIGLLGACLTLFAIWAGISGQQSVNSTKE